jgi:hypothetical protein
MKKALWLFLCFVAITIMASSCNHNKIACPTYADSFPETNKKKSKKPEAPQALPKGGKPKLSIMPPGH